MDSRDSRESRKENRDSSNQEGGQDVSLCDISNIPMAKSVRGSYVHLLNSQVKPPRRKGLEIFTLEEDSLNQRAALSQPTATFAMQRLREKENGEGGGGGLMFRNK